MSEIVVDNNSNKRRLISMNTTTAKLLSKVRSMGLFARSWSADDTCFAIYDEDGEGFLGTVALQGVNGFAPVGSLCKRELSILCRVVAS